MDIVSCVKTNVFLPFLTFGLKMHVRYGKSTKLKQTGKLFWDSWCCLSAWVSEFWAQLMSVKWGVPLFICWLYLSHRLCLNSGTIYSIWRPCHGIWGGFGFFFFFFFCGFTEILSCSLACNIGPREATADAWSPVLLRVMIRSYILLTAVTSKTLLMVVGCHHKVTNDKRTKNHLFFSLFFFF